MLKTKTKKPQIFMSEKYFRKRATRKQENIMFKKFKNYCLGKHNTSVQVLCFFFMCFFLFCFSRLHSEWNDLVCLVHFKLNTMSVPHLFIFAGQTAQWYEFSGVNSTNHSPWMVSGRGWSDSVCFIFTNLLIRFLLLSLFWSSLGLYVCSG